MFFYSIGLLRFGGQLHHKQRTWVVSSRDVIDASSLKQSSAAHCCDPVGTERRGRGYSQRGARGSLGGAEAV